VEVSETDMGELAEMMVGRRVVYRFEKADVAPGEPVLRVEGLEALDDRGIHTLRGVDLEVRGSEILGLAGIEGNGQTELVEALMGLREARAGRVFLESNDITGASPDERIRAGVSHIPEDRYKRGIVPDFSVTENLILGSHREARFSRWGFVIDYDEAASHAQALVSDYSIVTPGVGAHAGKLSGGNQQKVIVAREFDRNPCLIIAAQPTRGLDVGATEYVRRKLLEMRDGGSAVLLISADLDEIWALSDRIAVIYEGRIVAVREPGETDEKELGLLMTGGRSG
jgi:simple sugar transport system ATP-binding protein